MKKILCFFLIVCNATLYAQERKVIPIVSNEVHSLNGGLRSQFGGRSRVTIPVEIPPNTIGICYTVQTHKAGEAAEKNLDLVLALGTLIYTGNVELAEAVDKIDIPESLQTIDVYLLPSTNDEQKFLNKLDGQWRSFDVGNRIACKRCKVIVECNKTNRSQFVFLGIRNPSSLDAVDVIVNCVAVVQK